MAWIQLVRESTPESRLIRRFFVVERIRVRQEFLYFFDLVFGSTSFVVEYDDEGTVENLIDWINATLSAYPKFPSSKFQATALNTAKDKVLPVLKCFRDTDCTVLFLEENR